MNRPWLITLACLALSACAASTITEQAPPELQPSAPDTGLFVDANGTRQWLTPSQLQHTGRGSYQWPDGRSYEGQWQAGIPTGTGRGQLGDGSQYKGQWQNGLPHGNGSLRSDNGDEYEGQFDAGTRAGQGVQRNAFGQYRGQWRNDQPNGEGVFHGVDGSEYQGQYQQGSRHGAGRFLSASGSVYDGDWLDDEPSGFGILITPDGGRHEGQWLAGKATGYGVYSHPAGLQYQGAWNAGVRSGFGEEQRPEGTRYEGEWQGNQQHGAGTLHFANGTIYQGSWHSGSMRGSGKRTFPAGYSIEGQWQDAVLEQGTLRLLGDSTVEYRGALFNTSGERLHPAAAQWLQQRAQEGSAAAAFLLADRATDANSARPWLLQAAQANISAAQYALGKLLLESDLRSAVDWLNKAANDKPPGHAEAQFLLGSLYHFGEALTQDEDQAETYYQAAIANGSLAARRNLALMLATTSIDYLHDPQRALELIEPLANLYQSPSALDALATVYAANGQFANAANAQRAAIAGLETQEQSTFTDTALATMQQRVLQFEAQAGQFQGSADDSD
ncbi:MAG: hypothetical protein ACR2PZ_12300 [Pseudomonadales bacterium]